MLINYSRHLLKYLNYIHTKSGEDLLLYFDVSNNIVNIQKILLLVFPSQKSTSTSTVSDVILKHFVISICCHSTKGSETENLTKKLRERYITF